jgi:hypothetical protein
LLTNKGEERIWKETIMAYFVKMSGSDSHNPPENLVMLIGVPAEIEIWPHF